MIRKNASAASSMREQRGEAQRGEMNPQFTSLLRCESRSEGARFSQRVFDMSRRRKPVWAVRTAQLQNALYHLRGRKKPRNFSPASPSLRQRPNSYSEAEHVDVLDRLKAKPREVLTHGLRRFPRGQTRAHPR